MTNRMLRQFPPLLKPVLLPLQLHIIMMSKSDYPPPPLPPKRCLDGTEGLAKEELDGLAKDGTELIVKGSLICCNQMTRSSSSRRFNTESWSKGFGSVIKKCNIPLTKLNLMHNPLRIFGHNMVLDEGQCETTFDKLLVYKGETVHFPFKWSCLENLRFLSYRPQNLKLLQEIPSSNLKHIELDGSLCSESEILTSHIQQLQALQVLRLINFRNLEKLPEEWGKYLRKNLKELTLSHCPAMKHKDCKSLSSSLRKLNMSNCVSLKSLPSSFGKALDSDSRRLFQHKGVLSDSPPSEIDSDYETDGD